MPSNYLILCHPLLLLPYIFPSLRVFSNELFFFASGGQGIRSDRVPEEPWMEVRDIVQEVVIKTIPKKKKCKELKWLSEEALQMAEKRRKVKANEKKERHTHLNAEFQRIARRDKAFLSDQCKEIEENNRMGKTRDLFKKIRDTKEIIHAKMGTIKDRNGTDLTEAEDSKKRWQEWIHKRIMQKRFYWPS